MLACSRLPDPYCIGPTRDVPLVMGSALCGPRRKKVQVGASWVGNDSENPFETGLTKKERVLLRETFQVF
ncbi:hypothetical protein ANCCAN_14909 [Ancylostoma caninum]|uniref:Uncharacterized protein n=1 Tax=Ancylostoma caninum TaxID=29170 RepID=A0A368G415_ANCCA|nr:hypothetical protein ANCCAN_14909 [Ancylostoma caninum]